MIDWNADQSDKFIGTAAAIATAIAAAASAGTSIYAANKSSNAAESAAKSQSDAGVKAAQIQSDSADRQAALQAKSAADALAYSRQQSQLSLDQYNQQQRRLQPYRNLGACALGQPFEDAPPDLTLPNLPGMQTTSNAGPTVSGQTPSGKLTDPSTWMSLVGNTPELSKWVTQGLGAAASKPGLVDYYVGKIKGQPGANATEQAGSAAYWMNKLQSDPNGSGGGSTAAPAGAYGVSKPKYTPLPSMNAHAPDPGMDGTFGTLQAPTPTWNYRTLAQIAGAQ